MKLDKALEKIDDITALRMLAAGLDFSNRNDSELVNLLDRIADNFERHVAALECIKEMIDAADERHDSIHAIWTDNIREVLEKL